MPYVFSTLTCDNAYTIYAPASEKETRPVRSILVKGGHGLADKRLVTPIGVATQVSKEDLAALMEHPEFKAHKERGYITVREKQEEPEKIAADMQTADGSAPVTPSNYAATRDDTTAIKPSTGAVAA